MNTSRSNVRFRWLAGAVVSALALAACGSDDDASSAPETTAAQPGDGPDDSSVETTPPDSTGDDGWTFTDDRGVTITLDEMPTRIVAYVGTAAVLWDFGVRPVGVFGPQRMEDGTPEPAAGNVDLDVVANVGDTWDGANLELLADLDPDLVVSGGTVDPWVIGDQIERIEAEIAPVALIEVYKAPASEIIGNYARFAEAVGVDLDGPELVAARAAYDAAALALTAATEANPGVSVLATYADPGALTIAKPIDFPDLLEFQNLGVDVINPDTTEEYWEPLSWEVADKYPADLIMHDIRSYSLQPDVLAADYPTWNILPAVQANQVIGWSAEAILSYQGFTAVFTELAAAIAAADPDTVP